MRRSLSTLRRRAAASWSIGVASTIGVVLPLGVAPTPASAFTVTSPDLRGEVPHGIRVLMNAAAPLGATGLSEELSASGAAQDFVPEDAPELQALERRLRELEAEKLEVEVGQLRREFERWTWTWVVNLLAGLGAVGALGGVILGLLKFFSDRRETRVQSVRARFHDFLQQLGGATGQARVTAAASLKMMADHDEWAVPGIRREVIHTLLSLLATERSSPERPIFVSVLNSLLLKFEGDVLHGPPLGGADLSNLRFDGTTIRGTTAVGSRLDDTSFREAVLEEVRFQDVEVGERGVAFDRARLDGVEFRGGKLKNASFAGAMVKDLLLHDCTLATVQFIDLEDQPTIQLQGCKLIGVSFEGTDISRLTLRVANQEDDIDFHSKRSLALAEGLASADMVSELKEELEGLRRELSSGGVRHQPTHDGAAETATPRP